MVVGTLSARLLVRESRTLKDKRQVVRSILDRLKAAFNVSAAEVDTHDDVKVATLGVRRGRVRDGRGAGHAPEDRRGAAGPPGRRVPRRRSDGRERSGVGSRRNGTRTARGTAPHYPGGRRLMPEPAHRRSSHAGRARTLPVTSVHGRSRPRFDGEGLRFPVVEFVHQRGYQVYDICGYLQRPVDDALEQIGRVFARSARRPREVLGGRMKSPCSFLVQYTGIGRAAQLSALRNHTPSGR